MIFKKESLVFLTSLAVIFVIGYINIVLSTNNVLEEPKDTEFNDAVVNELNVKESCELDEALNDTNELDEALKDTDELDEALNDDTKVQDLEENKDEDNVILGEIMDITDIVKTSAEIEGVSESFEVFKISKEKSNMDVVDHIEGNISNELISEETRQKFEDLLLTKNNQIQMESNIELMLQSKGYNETVAVIDDASVKLISNDNIEKADAVKILDVVVSETNYKPTQIKIVKFNNNEL